MSDIVPNKRGWRYLSMLRDLGVPVILSACLSWLIAQGTVWDKVDEGRALFRSIGFRYFEAIKETHFGDDGKLETVPGDRRKWENRYRGVMSDIREDFRSLRLNPYYRQLETESSSIHYVQNIVTTEAAGPTETLMLTLYMCDIYAPSKDWEAVSQHGAKQIVSSAKEYCVTLYQKHRS